MPAAWNSLLQTLNSAVDRLNDEAVGTGFDEEEEEDLDEEEEEEREFVIEEDDEDDDTEENAENGVQQEVDGHVDRGNRRRTGRGSASTTPSRRRRGRSRSRSPAGGAATTNGSSAGALMSPSGRVRRTIFGNLQLEAQVVFLTEANEELEQTLSDLREELAAARATESTAKRMLVEARSERDRAIGEKYVLELRMERESRASRSRSNSAATSGNGGADETVLALRTELVTAQERIIALEREKGEIQANHDRLEQILVSEKLRLAQAMELRDEYQIKYNMMENEMLRLHARLIDAGVHTASPPTSTVASSAVSTMIAASSIPSTPMNQHIITSSRRSSFSTPFAASAPPHSAAAAAAAAPNVNASVGTHYNASSSPANGAAGSSSSSSKNSKSFWSWMQSGSAASSGTPSPTLSSGASSATARRDAADNV